VHCFADEILPQDRPKRGPPIATARKWRPPGALQLNVAPPIMTVDYFA
jgi:hypothetical protein